MNIIGTSKWRSFKKLSNEFWFYWVWRTDSWFRNIYWHFHVDYEISEHMDSLIWEGIDPRILECSDPRHLAPQIDNIITNKPNDLVQLPVRQKCHLCHSFNWYLHSWVGTVLSSTPFKIWTLNKVKILHRYKWLIILITPDGKVLKWKHLIKQAKRHIRPQGGRGSP